jgi:imidazole glycerol-phosphate synthase subunit HisH
MIAVIDYGINNSSSVIRMVEKVGGEVRRACGPEELKDASKLILPGVGHFDEGMRRLNSMGFQGPLKEMIQEKNIPILGICLGMQLLCRCSEEGELPGLGFVPARVLSLDCEARENLKIPHMGWNTLDVVRKNSLIAANSGTQRFYFVHSYYVELENNDLCLAQADYGVGFCAAFQSNKIFGVQFHPEKSHRFGMSLMRNFVDL